ncbi:MAG TPA: aspartate aminotransferase family protein [Oscillospiraceae bacterium]|nr:aspartate aminotransferase family protein [Oscillospiraceae bacterium]HPF56475.1 aspartate aminotransferase family protein [Clostridiales bacterium]HPK34752.1 aspartate aminotransferase family protein [Oscillospiraceae bacterium]HPR76601.1 aspartate aminotransferase family protein [Oscillospiraceae bacterium]
MNDIFNLDHQYVADTYARFPVQIVKGKGSLVWDENGKEYIDMGGGIAVNTFGFSDDAWIAAVTAQLNAFQHTSNLYYTAPYVTLAQKLCERTGMKKVFFGNSGAEANECAIKAARKYAAEKKGADCYTIITLKNSFHGRTLTTLAATGQDYFHELYQPLTPGFVHAEAGNLEDMKQKVAENKVAAIMIEVIQGEGGVIVLTPEYVKSIAKLAQENDILLIVDEVQTGNGRTGQLFGYMNYGIEPDIITTAKGLGGGLPIGAAILGEKVKDIFTPGSHGSTFGGNPVSCAGAISILDRLDEKLLAEVREKGEYIRKELSGAKGIAGVDGMGLMLGIVTEKDAKAVVNECISRGVLPLTAKKKVRLLPALNIPMTILEKAVTMIKEVCAG